ncbi:DUF6402 family protein [Paraherbaspirillum soli]|uniref:DUF6402 family protein n=1 Tax=Paraherbaspirillum soli TaxID=631222 RepID=A0ABW0MBV3_9BURK
MSIPIAVAMTTPCSDREGVQCSMEILQLRDIPDTMDKMGWKMAAQIMRHWFSIEPAWVMPRDIKLGKVDPLNLTPTQYNDQIIKMAWLLKFPRAVEALNYLYKNWTTENGINRLKAKLKKAGWKAQHVLPFKLGSRSMSARELDSVCQVNIKEFGTKLDVLDELYGAIGEGLFKLAVVGEAYPDWLLKQDTFVVKHIGIYLRDTYDFNSDSIFEQNFPLGVWSNSRLLHKAETAAYMTLFEMKDKSELAETFPGLVPVFNEDFRRYQKLHNAGGDFVVYSDVMWVQVPKGMEIPIPW